MRRSHKTRLALFSMALVGLLLAAIFVATVVFTRRTAIADDEDEVRVAFDTVAQLRRRDFSMQELGEANPYLVARVYAHDGRLVDVRGRWPKGVGEPQEGFREEAGWLLFAGRAKGHRIVLAEDLAKVERGVVELAVVLAALWLPLTLLVGGATWLAAHSVFRPLTRLAEEAAAFEGSDLSRRLGARDQAEFGALTRTLNRMLARIEESSQRIDRFATDAAHELRTPLAIVRTQIETTLLRPRAETEYVASHGRILEETDRMTRIVEALLRSARGGTDPAPPLDLEPHVRAAGGRFDDSRLRMELAPATARALPEEVAVLVDNLLDNARRFAPAESEILLALAPDASGSGAELRIVDHGAGVRSEDAERVFERLFRADDHRNRASGGVGIGLAVCRRIVEARGGRLTVEATPGGGATFVAVLPAGEDAPPEAPPATGSGTP